MKFQHVLSILLSFLCLTSYCQEIDTLKLNTFFNSLEKRNEAMGSIAITKNGKLVYQKTIGFREINEQQKVTSTKDTKYRIWSITKTYVAVMIFQLIEEGKLSLDTKLANFYPQIPNANTITIKNMLSHRSGIFDYVNDTDEEAQLNTESRTHYKNSLVDHIATFTPNFNAGEDFRYSNSNYFLLGCIIERLDGNNFESSLTRRISSKIGLKNTFFGRKALKIIKNKANTYFFDKKWQNSPEEENYTFHLETADGGIVATPTDMALFMDALFDEKLITSKSLELMTSGDDFYKLGLMKTQFDSSEGFGHTGGWISESSLFHYPNDKLTIAYTTNGIVLRKEDILNNVLMIYHKKPFTTSMNRNKQLLSIVGICLILFILFKRFLPSYLSSEIILRIGFIIALLFWLTTFVAGTMLDGYSHIRDGTTVLDTFYSNTGTLMSATNMFIAILMIPFLINLYTYCKTYHLNSIAIIPLAFIPISLLGSMLSPFPNELYSLFTNGMILSGLSPLLACILWRGKTQNFIRITGVVCFLFMLISLALLISRPKFPQFISENFGAIQRLLFLGWTLWLAMLSTYFLKRTNSSRLTST